MPSNALVETAITSLSPFIYWKMNESSGTTITQHGSSTASSISLSGTYTLANAELISGDAARFITFDTDGKGTATKGNFAVPLEQTSISFFMKINADFESAASAPYLFALSTTGDLASANFQTSVKFNVPSRRIATFIEQGAGNDVDTEYGLFFPGNFYDGGNVYHIVITRGPDTLSSNVLEKIYVNGVLKFVNRDVTYPTGGDNTSFFINTQSDNRAGLNVSLGHFAVWRSVLTHSEIFSISEAAGLNDSANTSKVLDSESSAYWNSYANIQENLKFNSQKTLQVSSDPLLDYGLINPEENVEIEDF